MSSRRLNNLLRERILQSVLAYRFTEEEAILKKRVADIAVRIYDEVFSVEQQILMRSLPDGWLPTIHCVQVTIGGHFEQVCLPEDLPVPNNKEHAALDQYDGDHPIAVDWLVLEGDRADFAQRKKQAKAQILSVLESVTTVGALIAAWPDVAPFVPFEGPPTQLPVLPIRQLNQLLGLPVEKEKVAS